MKWTQEKQNLEEYHGESYLKLSSLEQDNALLKHEINRLSQTLEKAQAELTNWQKAFAESEQKYKSMTIQVKDQFEASFAHRLVQLKFSNHLYIRKLSCLLKAIRLYQKEP